MDQPLNAEDWLVANEFLNYGGRLAVVRAESTGALNATTGNAGVAIPTEAAWMAGAGNSEVFSARTSGAWGNSLLGVLVDQGPDYILDLASTPANITINAGDSLTFSNGVTGTVISGDEDALVITASGALTSAATLTDGGATVGLTTVKDWYLNTEIGSTGIKLATLLLVLLPLSTHLTMVHLQMLFTSLLSILLEKSLVLLIQS